MEGLPAMKGKIPSINIINNLTSFMHDTETKEMLADLIWLNAVIATELIQITENSSAILRKTTPPASCLAEHRALRETALSMAEKYRPGTMLAQHLGQHQ
jgi:hypothetical protein